MSWVVVAVSAIVISTGVSVYGQVQAAKTAKATGKYNAKVAENQAIQTEMDAAENIRRQRIANRKAMSMQAGRFAGAGVVINEGTPLELLSESAATLELEVQDYNRNARLQGQNLRAQGAMALYTGKQQAQAYQIGAVSTLLEGVGQAATIGAMSSGGKLDPNSAAGMEAAGAPKSPAVRSGY